jgi:hypothetical protein
MDVPSKMDGPSAAIFWSPGGMTVDHCAQDVYGNFLDHVPSDSTDYDASCICYKLPGAGNLPEIDVSSWPMPGRKSGAGAGSFWIVVVLKGSDFKGGSKVYYPLVNVYITIGNHHF